MKVQPVAIISLCCLAKVGHGWTKPNPVVKRPSRNTAVSFQMSADDASVSVFSKSSKFVKEKFSSSERQKIAKATTSGLAVSLAMVPEAVAFAFVAGVNPLVGLWTTVVLGFFAALLGGRAGICSSASGAVSVVIASLCVSHGPSYLSACAMVAGVVQIVAGAFGLGKLINLVPHPVMLGFVNGLAVVMTKSQMMHFKTAGGQFMSLTDPVGAGTYGIAALTMFLVKVLPRITKAVPPSLGAVSIASIVAKLFSIPAKTLADVAGASTFTGGFSVLPKIGLPKVPLSMETLQVVFPYAITMAAVGCLESLLTMQLLDGMVDDGTKGSGKQECFGQGIGNILSGLTGGIGGCALLGQSIINVQSGGGISRWSGMSMALFLAIGIVAAAPLLGSVPVASLVGVMLLVCQSTFSWSSLRLLRKIPKLDVLVIALVSIVTVKKDLAIAVLAGIIASALGFAYKQSTSLTGTFSGNDKKKTYSLDGPLFFGSTSQFDSIFSPKSDPGTVILDLSESRIMDHSAVDAIHNLSDKYTDMGKSLLLQGLCSDSTALLLRYCQGRKSPPFQFVGSEFGDSGSTTVYSSLPL
jgi:SulP family sulfate permease